MKAIDFSLDGRLDFVITSDFSVQVHKRCLYCGGRAKFSLETCNGGRSDRESVLPIIRGFDRSLSGLVLGKCGLERIISGPRLV